MRPSANISPATARIGPGTSGAATTMKPYKPPFDCTALTRATAGAGKSAYVSGIQVWRGQTGVLTRKPSARPAKIHAAQAGLAIHVPAGGGNPMTSVDCAAMPKAALASNRHKPPAKL